MKSIFLTLSAAVCFNLMLMPQAVAQNFSLWPKRPPEIEQARRLVRAVRYDEAVNLLKPFIVQDGVVGREARKITAAVEVPRYLSRRNPHAAIYTVRYGDNLQRIVVSTQCPTEMIMLLNGIIDPSALRAGQRMVVVKMNLRAEIYPQMRELCVWDEESLVASYDIATLQLPNSKKNIVSKVDNMEGTIDGGVLPKRSTQYLASQRTLRLDGGIAICSSPCHAKHCIEMNAADVNELALLLSVGSEVVIVNE